MSVIGDRDAITVPTARKWARVIASLTERFSDLDISTFDSRNLLLVQYREGATDDVVQLGHRG